MEQDMEVLESLTGKSKIELKANNNHERPEVLTSKSFNKLEVQSDSLQTKLYRRRWLMLLLFTLFTLGNKTQWVQYIIILNIVTKYFNVSTLAAKGTAMVYNVSFFFMLYPVTYIIHKWGTRWTLIIASGSTCLGMWIKYLSISPDRYVLTMVGQCFVGSWQIVILTLPSILSSHWFGPDEVSTGTAIGMTGMTIGIAIYSGLTPIVVKMHDDLDDIGADLKRLTLPMAGYCTLVFILILFLFEKEPKLPPSRGRALQKLRASNDFEFWGSLSRLLRNKNYLLLLNSHGIAVGQMLAIKSTLNVFYLAHFQSGEEVGKAGLVFILSSLLGMIACGRILDLTKKFKTTVVCLYFLYILTTLMLGLSFYFEVKWAVFVAVGLLGGIGHGYYVTSLETCVELTYPELENFCINFLNLSNQIYTAILIVISDKLIITYNENVAHVFFLVIVVFGFILAIMTADEQKRQNATKIINPVYRR